jgi:hypothetical protein
MKTAIALAAVLLIAVGVFISVADAQLWRWMMKALGLITAFFLAVRAGACLQALLSSPETEDEKIPAPPGGWYVNQMGHSARPRGKADNKPDPDLIEQLRNTWQDEK